MFKIILVPLDGSPLAEMALEAATRLALRTGAELLLVHTTAPDDEPERAVQSTRFRGAANPQSYLDSLAEQLLNEGVVARTELLPKEPVEGIVDEAALNNVDLIVMTTHGRKGLDALLHPSVTWRVLQQTEAPILACKSASRDDPAAPASLLPRFMTDKSAPILVPLDGSTQAEAALPLALELARMFGNPLLLVRASEQPTPMYPTGATWGTGGVGDDSLLIADATQQMIDATWHYLERKQQELADQGVPTEIASGPGPAAFLIQETARQRHAGLIVMTSRGRGWLGRLVLGSVAQSVLRDVDMPVLLARRQPVPAEQE